MATTPPHRVGGAPGDVVGGEDTAVVPVSPFLRSKIEYAVSLILVSRPMFFDAVRHVVWQAERSGESESSPRIAALRSIALTMQGDWTLGGALAREALAELGESWSTDAAGRFAWDTAARGVALSESWDEASDLVRDATIAMRRDAERGLSLEGVRALGEAMAGRPVDALRVAAGVRHAAASMSILRSELGIAEAIARREIGDRQRALDELHAIADAPTDLRLYCTVAAMLELALAAADEGDELGAWRELTRAQALVADEHGGSDLGDWVGRVGTVVALVSGNFEVAGRSAATVIDSFWGPISRARVELATGNTTAARESLAEATPRCVRHEVVQALLIARAAPNRHEAMQEVIEAVELASRHGLLQTVASDGRELMELIERAAWCVSGGWLDRLRLLAARGRVPPRSPVP